MSDIVVLPVSMHGMTSQTFFEEITERLPSYDIEYAESPAVQRSVIEDATVVMGGRFPDELLERATDLELFACCWAGVDHLNLDAMAERDIAVTNASGVHGPNIAGHVMGWFLMLTHRLDEGIRRQERNEWRHFQALGELDGSRVCVVGMGAIGEAIVERLSGFDVETVGIRYSPEKGGPTDEVYGFEDIPDALAGVDYVAIAAPLTEATRGLFDREAFKTLPPDAILVNVGRGPIVDTDDLVRALQSGHIHAAGLDVTDPEPLPGDHPLWDLGNAYITPHNAGYTPYYWERLADILVRNLEQVEETGSFTDLENQVL